MRAEDLPREDSCAMASESKRGDFAQNKVRIVHIIRVVRVKVFISRAPVSQWETSIDVASDG